MEGFEDMAGGRTLSLRQRIRMEREQEKIVESEIQMERKRIERMKASLQMLAWEREHTQASMQNLIHKGHRMKEEDSLHTFATDWGAQERERVGGVLEDEVERPYPPFLAVERPYGYAAFKTPREAKEDKLKERYEQTVRKGKRDTASRASSRTRPGSRTAASPDRRARPIAEAGPAAASLHRSLSASGDRATRRGRPARAPAAR